MGERVITVSNFFWGGRYTIHGSYGNLSNFYWGRDGLVAGVIHGWVAGCPPGSSLCWEDHSMPGKVSTPTEKRVVRNKTRNDGLTQVVEPNQILDSCFMNNSLV